MNKDIGLFFVLLSMCLLAITESNAQSLIQLSDKIGNYNIQENVEVLPDSLGKLKIEQISSPAYAGKFQKGYDKNIWLANTKLKAHWLKLKVKNESNHNRWLIRIRGNKVTLFDQQINGSFKTYQMGDMIPIQDWYFKKVFANDYILPLLVGTGEEKIFYCHIETIDYLTLLNSTISAQNLIQIYNEKISILNEYKFINEVRNRTIIDAIVISGLLIMLFYHLILTFILKDKVYLYYVLYNFFLTLTLMIWKGWIDVLELYELPIEDRTRLFVMAVMSTLFFYTLFVINYLDLKKFKPIINGFIKYYLWIIAAIIVSFVLNIQIAERFGKLLPINHILLTFTLFIVALSLWNKAPLVKIFLLGDSFFMLSFTLSPLSFVLFQVFELPPIFPLDFSGIQMIDIGAYMQQIIFAYSLALRIQLSNKEKTQAQAETIKIQQEANQQLEQKVQERTQKLHENNEELQISMEQIHIKNQELFETLEELKSTQAQLIQSEKLASLGELTAGIAHEIQNPLNFVNNFAEVSAEMLGEIEEELDKGDTQEAKAIAANLKTNLEKINHHGKRASGIVKSMLEHSRQGKDAMNRVPTDLNDLADEYLRLAYHGLRAKDSSFNATLETHFEPALPTVEVIPQDIGRVLLNLINNAFYAVNEKAKQGIEGYLPTVTVRTKELENAIEITVQDNGLGIPETIRDKIFQPFFTTKPTGQGTGLGLSLAYDIVVKGHGGSLDLQSTEGIGTMFIIQLPLQEILK